MKRVVKLMKVFSIFMVILCLPQVSWGNSYQAQSLGISAKSSKGSCEIVIRTSLTGIIVISQDEKEVLRRNINQELVFTEKDLAPGSYEFIIYDNESDKTSKGKFSCYR